MKRNITYRFSWILLLAVQVAFLSCGKDEPIERYVQPSLVPYFDRFVAQGILRGVLVDLEELHVSGYIRLITEPDVIGQCAHSDSEPNTVIIDKVYWDKANDLQREFVVFHELGHCALNRGHLDDADNQGNCISIMNSGTGACNVLYTSANRSQMLDELFMK